MIAINHTSYVDWAPAALAMYRRHRRMRFMIKAEMQQVKVVNFLIKRSRDHPGGPRRRGRRLRGGCAAATRRGVVGVYPEATISRSFELKEFKSGAARMAREADVPIVPLIVWGAQRIWTKDHPRHLGRRNVPITVSVGAPLRAADDMLQTDAALRESMSALLHQVQQRYVHAAGAVLGSPPAGRQRADPGRGGSDGSRRSCGQGREPDSHRAR